ncbi:MAG TPA: hypothetical protein VIU11_26290, partial [Nakamurella sp.]
MTSSTAARPRTDSNGTGRGARAPRTDSRSTTGRTAAPRSEGPAPTDGPRRRRRSGRGGGSGGGAGTQNSNGGSGRSDGQNQPRSAELRTSPAPARTNGPRRVTREAGPANLAPAARSLPTAQPGPAPESATGFAELGVPATLLPALATLGAREPFPIQA